MSRGLQMIVEEGEHSSCVHAVRSVGKQDRPRFSSKNGKNRLSSTDDERKTVKTAFHPRMMSEKRKKPRFIHG